jgi:hypothetical protein
MPRPRPDLVGKRFGMLRIIQATPDGLWLAQCDCGETKKIRHEWVSRKLPVRSCGCLKYKGGTRRKVNTKHSHASDRMAGRGQSKFYKAWTYIKRTAAKTGTSVDMDPRWTDFMAFLAEVPMHPEENGERWSLVRVDDTDGWHKDNVEWIPFRERARRLMLRHIHGVEP